MTVRNVAIAAVLCIAAVLSASPSWAAKRAILVGFSDYSWAPLPGVKTDMRLLGPMLSKDYQLTVIDDKTATRDEFYNKWADFVDSIKPGDEVLIYYDGHGIDVDGANYLIPLSAPAPDGAQNLSVLRHQFILLRDLMQDVQKANPAVTLFVVDACRTNPYAKVVRGAQGGGLHREVIERYGGYTVVFFSADFDQPALDSVPMKPADSGSPFMHAFVDEYPKGKTYPLLNFVQLVSWKVQELVTPKDQVPTFQGMGPANWCLGACDEKLMEFLFASTTGKRTVVDATPAKLGGNTSDVPFALPPMNSGPRPRDTKQLKDLGNVVFLGKRSEGGCRGNNYSADNPFGCEFLKKALSLSSNDGTVMPGDLATATTFVDVNRRRSAPRVEGTQAYYDCSVGVLKKGSSIKLKGVAAYKYVGDTFLWGVIDDEQLAKCK